MNFRNIPYPEVYNESQDFRFFINWFASCLSKISEDTDNLYDLYDPERCPTSLLWMLADTIGYKYDSRFIPAYNRFVIKYFMSMIKKKGSQAGMMIAAEANLAQFNLNDYAKEDEANIDRLADDSLPTNSVYLTQHPADGYIDIVYYSENVPQDACLEYVRPLGMYCFTHAGVSIDAKTKISVDARLTDSNNINLKVGPTRINHYRRSDYASIQKVDATKNPTESRQRGWYRNSKSEGKTTPLIKQGYRTLYSLQLCNNEHVVKSLLPSQKDADYSVFSLGYNPEDVNVRLPDNYLKVKDDPSWNLRYDEQALAELGINLSAVDEDRTSDIMNSRPAVNPPMMSLGDAISLNTNNNKYIIKVKDDLVVEDK